MAWERDPLKALRSKISICEDTSCWNWTGMTFIRGGYGVFTHRPSGRFVTRAHRASWELHRGAIPLGADVLHKCDNRICVNPDHLFLGTQAENMKDKVRKGRQNKGESHGRRKLTETQVIAIRSATGKAKEIAAAHGISEGTVYDIKRRKSWSHLP